MTKDVSNDSSAKTWESCVRCEAEQIHDCAAYLTAQLQYEASRQEEERALATKDFISPADSSEAPLAFGL